MKNSQAAIDHGDYFVCDKESAFYALCLQHLVFQSSEIQDSKSEQVLEFGSGDSRPTLQAIHTSGFKGKIYGYEINETAALLAQQYITERGREKQYHVQNSSFWETTDSLEQFDYLIANPPYVPAPDAGKLLLPALWGGHLGDTLSQKLLTQDISTVMLLVSSIAHPLRLIHFALEQGYHIHRYLITPMGFGFYTTQNYVHEWLKEMANKERAFFLSDHYLLAGVLFCKAPAAELDLASPLLQSLTLGKSRVIQ